MSNAFHVGAGTLARRSFASTGRAALLATSALFMFSSPAHAGPALPIGGTVASGSASVVTTANAVTVTQTSNRAIVNWQGFSVGQGDTVTFNQPNAQSATLNRVTGNAGSQIAGLITSNGAVYLINPNGIAITKSGTVQTGGGFVASTLDISDADFNAGKLNFAGNGASASVSNAGTITAGSGAYVALLGGTVSNAGMISVPLGKVGLGSGEQIGLDLNGGNFMQVAIPTTATGANGAALIDMAGTIAASGGRITLSAASARNAVRNVINLSGTISADSAVGTAGSIQLLGAAGGTVTASGTLSARATGAAGDGGSVETSGATVNFVGLKVDTSAKHGTTGHWLIDPTDLTVDATAASTINSNLATSNVTLTTDGYGGTTGPGVGSSGAGDININSALAWSSANTLTLSAYHNIAINAAINAPNGGLTLTANNSGYQPASTLGASASVSVGSFVLNSGNWVQSSATLPGFSAASFSFNPQNASFLRVAGGDGSTANPYLLTDIYGVQGMRSYSLLAQNFALANDVDASGTAGWNAGAGFAPIGDNASFTGNFDGKSHTISGLFINAAANNVGLFAQDSGNISNLALVGGSITNAGYIIGALVGYQGGGTISNVSSSVPINGFGDVGGLVGIADGSVVNSHATGGVSGTSDNVGGLVGYLGYRVYTASISGSSATGDVTDTSTRASDVGGLVGFSVGTIDASYASGKVTGSAGVDSVGGLVGGICSQVNGCSTSVSPVASITNSYALGDVSSGNGNVGGLVGQVYNGNISNSYAKGKVTNTGTPQYVGGLVGSTNGTNIFTNVYATGDVSGATNVGGLVGDASGTTISQAHASGNVTATQDGGNGGFGGLVGTLGSTSSITGSFATGDVTHGFQSNAYGASVGGLVGVANGSVTYSYATGAVSGTNDDVGGLIGRESNQSGITDTNNFATGSVTGNTTPDAYFSGANVGGLIGAVLANETIAASYATGNVSAAGHTGGQNAGGLIGSVGNVALNLSKSFASGNVSVIGAVSTVDGYGNLHNAVGNKVGGLIGDLDNYGAVLDQVYATGNVAADGQLSEVGGLIGYAYDHSNGQSIIKNSYATGSVTGLGQYAGNPVNDQANDAGGGNYKQNVGGLIGRIGWGAVANTYAVGTVSGGDDIGGLVGYAAQNASTVTSSYTTGYDNAQGGAHLTSAQMQDINQYATTYTGWDFGTIWAPPSAGYYPQLYALTPVVYATAGNATTTYGTAPTSLGTYKGGTASYVFGPAGDMLTGFLAGSTTATVTSNVGQYAITPYAGGTVTSAGGVVYRVISDGSGTLTVNPTVITATQVNAALTGSVTKTYDGTTSALLTSANFLLTGFMNGNGASVNQTAGTFASANAGTGILVTANLSSTNFVANSNTNLANYILPTTASGTIGAITPAQLSLTYTADQLSRIYGNANPALTGSTSISGLVTGDSLASVLAGTASFGTTATTTSNAGSYGVVGSGLMSASTNYTLVSSQAAGNASALQITPRSVSVTANGASGTYGSAIPALTYVTGATATNTGIVNGDTLTGALATTGSATSNVGQYAITQGTLGNPNYNVTYTGGTLVINPATLQITYSATPITSIYGNAITNLGGTETASGLVNGDTLAGVTLGTAAFNTTATAKSNVGSYGVVGLGLTLASTNYTLVSSQAAGNASALQITPRTVSITANGASSTYGSAIPALTYVIGAATANTGFVNGDTLTGALASAGGATSNAGQYAITQGTLGNPNYNLAYTGSSLVINPATLQITYTATPITSIYGNAITNLGGTETAVGLVNGDTIAGVTSGAAVFATTATAKSNVGSYGETGSGLSMLSKNYTATFVQAAGNTNALTISPRSITVTANPESRYILLPNPPLKYTVGGLGLANGDTLSGNLATTAQPLSPLGSYAITQGTLAASPNYKLTYVGANLAVTPPPTQSLSQFLAWLNQVIIEFEPREQKCSSNAISTQLREGKSVSFSKTGCGH